MSMIIYILFEALNFKIQVQMTLPRKFAGPCFTLIIFFDE
jgi:hypothetical protein